MEMRVLLIDATSLAFRAYYAFSKKPLINSKGINTSGPFAFINSLEKLKRELNPTHILAVFDAPHKTFRHELYKEYKAQRPKPPDEIKLQIEYIKSLLDAYSITYLEIEGVEADDVIATFVEKYTGNSTNTKIFISTQDKDLLQLISNDVFVVQVLNREVAVFDAKRVIEKFKVPPDKIPDYLALVGDNIDNIPGVRGIGEKTAVELLSKYGGIEDIYEHLDEIDRKVKEKLVSHREDCFFSKELVLLKKDVQISIDFNNIKINKPDRKRLAKVLKFFEFDKLLSELATEAPKLNFIKGFSVPMDLLQGFAFDMYGDNIFTVSTSREYYNISIEVAKKLLENHNIPKYVFNYKDTYRKLLSKGINLAGVVFDLPLASYLIEPERGHYSMDRFLLEEFLFLPPEGDKDRSEYRAFLALELMDNYKKALNDMGLTSLYFDIELPLARVLAIMEEHGTLIDTTYLAMLKDELVSYLEKLSARMHDISGEKVNLNSPKQLARVLFEKLKLPPVKKTKTGYSTDQETLEKLKDKHKFVELLLDFRELYKIKSTYIEPFFKLVDETGRVHPTFNQMHTITGRLSCKNPNLQNLPIKSDIGRKIRKGIIAPKGYLIASFDYSQIELRITAHLSGENEMVRAFRENADIHTQTASLIFQKPVEDVTDRERRVAKTVNFGIIYGISPYGLSKQLGISVEEAQGIIYNFFAIYPGIHTWITDLLKEVEEKGFTRTMFGRIRRISQIKSSNANIREMGKRMAINTPVQGSAADIIKKAMVEVERYIEEKKVDAHMILQVHDELVFEVKEDIIDEFVHNIQDIMENIVKLNVPLKVDAGFGEDWLTAH